MREREREREMIATVTMSCAPDERKTIATKKPSRAKLPS